MDNTALFIVAVVVILAVVMVAWWFAQRRRSAQLQEHFGPEYERTVDEIGDRRKAESELASREKRVNELSIRDLSPVERTNFADSWRDIQAHFVDDPVSATGDADRLVVLVMEARGYPMGDFDQRAADISVQHPDLVQNYRGARDIHLRSERGDASTEDLRQAMVHYRSLFAELLGEKQDAAGPMADHRVA